MKQMENNLQAQTEIDKVSIGVHKYNHLKSIESDELTAEQLEQIKVYESKNRFATLEQIQATHDYFDKLHKKPNLKANEINAKKLYELFKSAFPIVNNRPFIKIDKITISNLEPLIYYFTKDDRFYYCANVCKLSEPSFDKGLLIIGNFGNGKTATMKTFEYLFAGIDGFSFKGYSANEVVTMFEKCVGDDKDILINDFERKMYRGTRYFDDLKTERTASNYGKVNLFKEIIEERYNRFYPTSQNGSVKKLKTYVTANYKDGFPDNMEKALDEFSEKYGERVYDRIFEMFNIIEFNGKSFRK